MQKHGSEEGSENPHFLLLEVEGEYTSTRASASTCTCSAGARVTDDGSLCLGTPSLSTRPAASQCQSGAGDSRKKKIYEGSTCSAGARASRTTEACAWVYLASGSRTRLLIVSSATGKIQIQGLWRHCVIIFAEAWKRGGIRKSTLFIAGG